MQLVAAVLFAIVPLADSTRESCDLIELNHFFDEHGRLVFDQVIFWDWSAGDARYNVRAWRLVKQPSQLPARDWGGRGYSATWHDGETLRQTSSRSFRETWTQYDLGQTEVAGAGNRQDVVRGEFVYLKANGQQSAVPSVAEVVL